MKPVLQLIVALFSTLTVSAASAGIYTDDLSRCLIESTTKDDRVALVKWMFSAATVHPVIEPLSTVSDADREISNQTVAELFMRLVTESCKQKTQMALKYEGPATLQLSFQVLGQVAGAELFADPAVTRAISGMERYFDPERLEALLTEQIAD